MKDSPISVLFISRFCGTGGAERTVLSLAKYLSNKGYNLSLFQFNNPQDINIFDQFPGDVFLPNPSRIPLKKFLYYYDLLKLLKKADIVIATSELTPTYFSYFLTQIYKKPLIADVQVYLSSWIESNCNTLHLHISSYIYSKIKYIRCVSEGIKQDLSEKFQIHPRQCSVIYVPCDLESITNLSEQSIPSQHQDFFKLPTIISIGRFTNQKRFDIAIQAFFSLIHNYNVNANLVILGEGILRSDLEKQIQDLDLLDRVFLPGFIENPYPYLKQASVFLLSSDYEGLPRVLIEALSIGCPCVATDCPSGPYEILEGGQCGLLTPVRDTNAIANSLYTVLTDLELSNHLKKVGLKRSKIFESSYINQEYEELIQSSIKKSKLR